MASPMFGVLHRKLRVFTSSRFFSGTGVIGAKKSRKRNDEDDSTKKAVEGAKNYQEFLSWRRAEAARSVLVQVGSVQDASAVYRDLSLSGAIDSMHHFFHIKDYILVEFKEASNVPHFLRTVGHFNNNTKIPTQSRVVFFTGQQHHNGVHSRGHVRAPVTSRSHDKIQASHLFQLSSVSKQMEMLHQIHAVDECGTRLRFFLCAIVEDLLHGLLPHCRVLPFGSAVNGFGWRHSDLDMMVEQQHHQQVSSSQYKFMTKRGHEDERVFSQRSLSVISDILSHFAPCCYNVQRILNARIPIIKFVHEAADVECDLSFQNVSGPKMSELMYILGEVDWRVRPLVSTVKQWAQATGVTRPQPGVWPSNFTLLSMVIFFLQTRSPPILPSFKQLHLLAERRDHFMMDGMDYSFITDIAKIPRTTNTQSLEDLLLEFFLFYQNFNFAEQAPSLVEGCAVTKADSSPIYIENPLEVAHNIGRNVSAEELERMKGTMGLTLRNLEGTMTPRRTSSWGLMPLLKPSDSETAPSRSVQVSHLFEDSESAEMGETSDESVR